jgi:hypothetical protein
MLSKRSDVQSARHKFSLLLMEKTIIVVEGTSSKIRTSSWEIALGFADNLHNVAVFGSRERLWCIVPVEVNDGQMIVVQNTDWRGNIIR